MADNTAEPDTVDDSTDDDEMLIMQDELEIELDDYDKRPLVAGTANAQAAWRRIEQLREQRHLRLELEDFDQYVV